MNTPGTAHYPVVDNVSLVDPTAIATFFDMLWGYVEWEDRILGLRGIGEKGTQQEGRFREPIWISPRYQSAAHTVAQHAARWSQWHVAAFLVPAVLFPEAAGEREASERHIAEFTALIADLDAGDIDAKLDYLSGKIGPPTMLVYSGGITDIGQPKRHAYWALTEPTKEVETIGRLRLEMAQRVAADQAFGRITQIIRVPGTVHSKYGRSRTVGIASYHKDREYELGDLADAVASMPRMPGVEAPAGPLLDFAPGSRLAITHTLTTDIHEGGDQERNRWTEFTRTAGWELHLARHAKITVQQAYENTCAWVVAHMVPPWPRERIDVEFKAVWEKDIIARGPFPEPLPPAQVLLPKQPALQHWDVGTWAMADPAPRRHLVQGLVMVGQPHTVAAEGGAGKTFLLIELALRLASHDSRTNPQHWLGQPLTIWADGGTVVLLTAEDDYRELHIRLRDIDPTGQLRAKAAGRLRIVPLVNAGGAFPLVATGLGEPRPSNRWAEMYNEIAQIIHGGGRVSAVMFDTLAATLHGEDISNEVVTQYFTQASRVCGDFDAALIVSHHTRKGSSDKPIRTLDDMKEAVRGGSAVMGSSRVVLGLWHATDFDRRMRAMGEIPKRGHCYRLGVVKANNPEMTTDLKTLLRLPSGLLEDATERDKLLHVMGDENAAWLTLAIEKAAKDRHPLTKAGNFGVFARRASLPGNLPRMTKGELESLVDRLLDRKKIVLAKMAGKTQVCLDMPEGPITKGMGYRDDGTWKPDWSGFEYDEGLDDVVVV